LSNKDYFQNSNKVHDYADIHDNMDILEDMIVTIVELLEEKISFQKLNGKREW